MKQGKGMSSQGAHKQEPISKAVNPKGVAQIGTLVGNAKAVEPLYQGRGATSPAPKATTTHVKGSQGRH